MWVVVSAIPLDHPVVFLQIQPLSAIFTFTAVKQRQACAAGIAAVHVYVVDTLCQRTDALDETKVKECLFLTHPAVFVSGQQYPSLQSITPRKAATSGAMSHTANGAIS